MWLVGVVLRRYIDFLILLIPTPLVSVLFCSSIPTFYSFFKMFFVLVYHRSCYLCGSEIYANLLKLPTTKFMREIFMRF